MLDERFWNRAIFEGIAESSKEAIRELDYWEATYHANEMILSEGAPIDHFCIMLEGVIKTTEYTSDGKQLNSSYFFGGETLPGGDAFPFYMVYGEQSHYFCDTYCVKRARVIWLPVAQLCPVIERDPVFLLNILRFVSAYAQYSKHLMRCVQYRKVEDRLAYWLMNLNDPTQRIAIPNSQEVLADMLHVNRSSLNQALKYVEEKGVIRRQGKYIWVQDPDYLLSKK